MLIFLIIAIVVIVIIQKLSQKYALKGVSYICAPSKRLVAPGEQFKLIATLANNSRRFISYIQIVNDLPLNAVVRDLDTVERTEIYRQTHTTSVYMMPRRKLSYDIHMSLPMRGVHVFHGAKLSGGDFLGISETSEYVEIRNEIVVYPPDTADDRVSTLMNGFLGNVSVRRFIMEDPMLIAGFREYTGREPMKTISWLKSAQANQVMVKTFDYTTELTISVLLNIEITDRQDVLIGDDRIEACYTIAHTVCRILEERGIRYDFSTNARTYGLVDIWHYIGDGLGQKHFQTVLECLGRGSDSCFETFEALLARTMKKKLSGRSYIVITPNSKQETEMLLKQWDDGRTLIISPD